MFWRALSGVCLVLFSVLFTVELRAQPPVLPDLGAGTSNAINFLSWTCQYDGIKSIGVQRSNDSIYNFTTIGYVANTKQGVQAYIDGHPMPGKNFYRLYIIFSSDLTWYSNRIRVDVSEDELLAQKLVLPPNDSLQKYINSKDTGTPLKEIMAKVNLSATSADQSAFTYAKSQYIYTNPLTGHVNIEVQDVLRNKYNVRFYDYTNKEVLEIPKVMASPAIIDKRNFQKKGIFKFVLKKNNALVETGYITIY
jgi:hypothetical protein